MDTQEQTAAVDLYHHLYFRIGGRVWDWVIHFLDLTSAIKARKERDLPANHLPTTDLQQQRHRQVHLLLRLHQVGNHPLLCEVIP